MESRWIRKRKFAPSASFSESVKLEVCPQTRKVVCYPARQRAKKQQRAAVEDVKPVIDTLCSSAEISPSEISTVPPTPPSSPAIPVGTFPYVEALSQDGDVPEGILSDGSCGCRPSSNPIQLEPWLDLGRLRKKARALQDALDACSRALDNANQENKELSDTIIVLLSTCDQFSEQ